MGAKIDLVGKVFGRLTVVSYAYMEKRHHYWSTVCECGTKTVVGGCHLRSGHTKSCSCLNREETSKRESIHGQSANTTPEYQAWNSMKARCYNIKNRRHHRYGGRGIKVCEQWLHSFESFFADMGLKPSADYSLDRIDNDKDYSPDNCRWATSQQQSNNRSGNLMITHNGKTMTKSDWLRETGIPRATFDQRRKKGWSIERCLTPAKQCFFCIASQA